MRELGSNDDEASKGGMRGNNEGWERVGGRLSEQEYLLLKCEDLGSNPQHAC